jgi:hypothetical protein
MSTVGAHEVVQTQNRPTLINISSVNALQMDNTKSRGVWAVNSPINCVEDNFAAKVSLYSFTFYNSLSKNIQSSNCTLKILTLNSNSANTNLQTVTIPQGHYSISSLLNYLNTDGVCNYHITPRPTTGSDTVAGLGAVGDPNYPPFSVSNADPTRITWQPYPLGTYVDPAVSGGVTVNYQSAYGYYKGIYLVVDASTIPFLRTLGLIQLDAVGNAMGARSISSGSNSYSVIGFDINCQGTTNGSAYSYTNVYTSISTTSYTGPLSCNLASTNSIIVELDNIGQCGRNSFEGFRSSNVLARVPIMGAYGYKCHYEPSNPFESIVTNYSVSEFRLELYDASTGNYVDFQGADWVMTLKIEYLEIDNSLKNEDPTTNQPVFTPSMPMKRPRN